MKQKQTKTPAPVLLGRVRREIAFLKSVLKDHGISLPVPLINLLATELPERMHALDRRRLQLLRRQEKELRALRDRTCPTKVSYAPRIKSKPLPTARFCAGGLPSHGKRT